MGNPSLGRARWHHMLRRLLLVYALVELAVIFALVSTIGWGWTLLVLLATFLLGWGLLAPMAGSRLIRQLGQLRAGEQGKTDKPGRGNGTVCLPEMRRGGVFVCVATLIARVEHKAYSPVFGWSSAAQAWAQTQGQLAWYRAMEEAGEMVQIRDRAGLERRLGHLLSRFAVRRFEEPSARHYHPRRMANDGTT